MSSEEKDAILGRLMRELKESTEAVAFLEERLAAWAPAIDDVSRTLKGQKNFIQVDRGPRRQAWDPDAISRLPDLSEVQESITYLCVEREKVADLRLRLDKFK